MCVISCFVLIWLVFTVLASEVRGNSERCECRLPDSIIPKHYKIEIITHLENHIFRFDGSVSIKVGCHEGTNKVTLHSKDLKIEEASVTLQDLTEDKALKISNFTYDKENEFFIINPVEGLIKGHEYLISVPYVGELKDSMEGFYRSSYVDQRNNQEKWLAVTQLAATFARMAFPSFDEPAMKAVFQINLGRMQNYSTISNMPIASTEPMKGKPGWFWDHYEESLPMSTYLVAFIVSDFEYVSTSSEHGTTFRIWTRHDAMHQVQLAKVTGPKSLEFYTKYFNTSYPLKKLDTIAIPDFGAGAMENWGLVTFSESNLLYDVDTAATSQRTFAAQIIAHEIAHQWFGNLVTMKWWTDLWLNEGFATYMANLALQNVYPEWNIFTLELVNTLLSVFAKDSLKTSHPVSVPVNNPLEIGEIFDEISYDKGSFLVNMMTNFLGVETFRKGVISYLREHQFGNAEQDDLWQTLTTQAHIDDALPKNLTVKTIMDTWTLQTGYPVVTFTRNYRTNSAKLSQKTFLRDTNKTSEPVANCWWIPITYTTERKPNFKITRPDSWLSCPNKELIMHGLPNSDKWVILNLQAAGLYRVNYDEENWKLLISTLNCDLHNKISLINKVQLIEDSAYLAWSRYINYKIYFDILRYLSDENNYLPWRAAINSLETMENMLRRTSVRGLFNQYMKQLLTPIYKRVGGFKIPDNADYTAISHQVVITAWSCKYQVENCADEANKLFSQWYSKPEKNSIPKDLRSTVYCNAIKLGSEKEWDFLWKQYQSSNSAAEKDTILDALGCSTKTALLQRYLEWAITFNSGIRVQDSVAVLQAVAANEVGYQIAKDFIQTRIKDIHKHLAALMGTLPEVISTLASQMISVNELHEFKKFAETNKEYLQENNQGINQALETIGLNIQWQTNHYDEIKDLLPKYIK